MLRWAAQARHSWPNVRLVRAALHCSPLRRPGDEEALGAETAQALAPLVDLALELTQIAELTGRDAPTVIT